MLTTKHRKTLLRRRLITATALLLVALTSFAAPLQVASAHLDIRLLPDQDPAAFLAELRRVIADPRITLEEIEALEVDGIISGGMVPKVDCCIDALKGGVAGAHIIDGRLRHSILLEVFFDEGIGTMIDRDKEGALN